MRASAASRVLLGYLAPALFLESSSAACWKGDGLPENVCRSFIQHGSALQRPERLLHSGPSPAGAVGALGGHEESSRAAVLEVAKPLSSAAPPAASMPLVQRSAWTIGHRWGHRLLLLLGILAGISVCLLCFIRYKSPKEDEMLDRSPKLVHPDGGADQMIVSADQAPSLQAAHRRYADSSERCLMVRALSSTVLNAWSPTAIDLLDSKTEPILRATVTPPMERTTWYRQGYWHWQRDGLTKVWRATPIGRLFGVCVREHPAISIHSLMKRDVGAVYACCRAGEVVDGYQSMHLYDADDQLFGSIKRDPAQPRYALSAPSLGQKLIIEGSFGRQSVSVTNEAKESVAWTEPCCKQSNDSSAEFYCVRFTPNASWSTVVLVLLGLMSAELQEAVMSTAAAGT